jgi:hypothetical protein
LPSVICSGCFCATIALALTTLEIESRADQ